MRKTERVSNLFGLLVANKETKIVQSIVKKFEKALDEDKRFKADNLIDEWIKEEHRQTKGTYDEEEWRLGNLENKKGGE